MGLLDNRIDLLTSELYATDLDLDFSETTTTIPPIEVAHSIFAIPEYPSQIEPPDSYFVAEYQGALPNDKWSPKSSKFGWARSGNNGIKTYHNAIDLYAPHGTPLIAIVDGYVKMKPQISNERIGNRVWLCFELHGRPFRFVYGHLDRFEGNSRTVKRGDIIGYSGSSGNTPGHRATSKSGLVTDHVHLILFDDIAEKSINPNNVIKWNIRYWDDELETPHSTQLVKIVTESF